MKFRTAISPTKYPFHIGYEDPVMLMGSCFSDHIGHFFARSGFQTCSNPFGTLFNPISIAQDFDFLLNPASFDESWYLPFDGRWVSLAHYSKFSNADKDVFLQRIHLQMSEASDFLRSAHYLLITWGTAYLYRHLERNKVVANCHKMPALCFSKERLSINNIVETYQPFFERLWQCNNDLRIVLTVSPVRHLGDGFHENTLSKSVLHLAAEQLVDNNRVFYFPAYEILQDDLRDYRFYAADLCHPSPSAVEYIEDLVSQSFFTAETESLRKQKEKEFKASLHRPICD